MLIEQKATQLFSDEEWKYAVEKNETLGISLEYQSMLEQLYEVVYEESPESFDSIQWIDSDLGVPVWVRPGVTWVPGHQLEESD